MTRKLVAVGYVTLALTASAIPLPRPQPLLDGLLGHGRAPLSPNKGPDIIDLPLLRGVKPSRIIKKDLLGPLDDALAPILNPITKVTGDALSPLTGPLESVTGPLGSVLGVDLDLLTPTDLLCAKVDGEFVGKAYALGCVCLGQDGLLLTAEAGAEVVDGLVDWITAQVNARGFTSQYPEYSVPTCEQRTDDDGGDFRCPLGKERKPNGKCAAILLASTHPASSASSTPTINPASAPASASLTGPTSVAVNSAPPASSVSSATPTGAPQPSASDSPINIASTPVDDGEDAPYCDEVEDVHAQGADGDADDGKGEWVQVQSVTSTETVTFPATAYIQQTTVTETTTTTSISTTTVTSTSTTTSTATVTQTKTETVHDCEQSFAAAAVPPAPAPSRTPSPSVAVISSSAIGVASVAATSSSTPAPTAAPLSSSSSAPPPASSDDGGAQISVARLNAHPHSSSSAAPPCPSGQVMGATRCCPVDMIERDGACGCNDGYIFLINTCVEICLPPLQLIDGNCIEVDLGVASDVVDGLGLGGLTEELGLGDGLAGLL